MRPSEANERRVTDALALVSERYDAAMMPGDLAEQRNRLGALADAAIRACVALRQVEEETREEALKPYHKEIAA